MLMLQHQNILELVCILNGIHWKRSWLVTYDYMFLYCYWAYVGTKTVVYTNFVFSLDDIKGK